MNSQIKIESSLLRDTFRSPVLHSVKKILKPSVYIFTRQAHAVLEARREKSAPSLCSFLPATALIYGPTGSTAREKGRERKGQKKSSWIGAG